MNRKTLFLSFMLMLGGMATHAQVQQRLENHIYYMAADSLQGRKAGSADAQKVADYIEREFREMGLQPLFDSYRLYFTSSDAANVLGVTPTILSNDPEVLAEQSGTIYRDVVAVIEGSDPMLKNEYIVVGGHYDHLGVKNGKVYNGADDNASGTAAVIEAARQLMQHRSELKRSVIICAFDAEEIGLVGSRALAEKMNSCGQIKNVKMMMSIDMVGWLKQGKSLRFQGTGTLKHCDDMLADISKQTEVEISTKRFESSPFTATDTEPFASLGVPTLAVTTGLKSPYHKPGDDADLIDYPGLAKVTRFITLLTIRMASGTEHMEATGRLAAKHEDRAKVFEAGVIAGYNMSSIALPNTIFTLKSGTGFVAGVSTNLNVAKHWALEVDAQYHHTNSYYPNMHDPFNNDPDKYTEDALMAPAQLKYKIGGSSVSLNVGLGGYYGYRFSGTMSGNSGVVPTSPHQYGMVWSLEERFANLSLDFTWYYQFNNAIEPLAGSQIPPATRYGFTFTLGWYF